MPITENSSTQLSVPIETFWPMDAFGLIPEFEFEGGKKKFITLANARRGLFDLTRFVEISCSKFAGTITAPAFVSVIFFKILADVLNFTAYL